MKVLSRTNQHNPKLENTPTYIEMELLHKVQRPVPIKGVNFVVQRHCLAESVSRNMTSLGMSPCMEKCMTHPIGAFVKITMFEAKHL